MRKYNVVFCRSYIISEEDIEKEFNKLFGDNSITFLASEEETFVDMVRSIAQQQFSEDLNNGFITPDSDSFSMIVEDY